jgi:hypothetical protein
VGQAQSAWPGCRCAPARTKTPQIPLAPCLPVLAEGQGCMTHATSNKVENKAMSKTKIYDVTYAISSTETYRIRAKNREDADNRAFSEGRQLDIGETTSCDLIEIEEATSWN